MYELTEKCDYLCLQVLEIQNPFRNLFRRTIQSVFSQISCVIVLSLFLGEESGISPGVPQDSPNSHYSRHDVCGNPAPVRGAFRRLRATQNSVLPHGERRLALRACDGRTSRRGRNA